MDDKEYYFINEKITYMWGVDSIRRNNFYLCLLYKNLFKGMYENQNNLSRSGSTLTLALSRDTCRGVRQIWGSLHFTENSWSNDLNGKVFVPPETYSSRPHEEHVALLKIIMYTCEYVLSLRQIRMNTIKRDNIRRVVTTLQNSVFASEIMNDIE